MPTIGLLRATFSRFPLFLGQNAGDRLAVEQFFHAAGGVGKNEKEFARSSATIMIFGETGATIPRIF